MIPIPSSLVSFRQQLSIFWSPPHRSEKHNLQWANHLHSAYLKLLRSYINSLIITRCKKWNESATTQVLLLINDNCFPNLSIIIIYHGIADCFLIITNLFACSVLFKHQKVYTIVQKGGRKERTTEVSQWVGERDGGAAKVELISGHLISLPAHKESKRLLVESRRTLQFHWNPKRAWEEQSAKWRRCKSIFLLTQLHKCLECYALEPSKGAVAQRLSFYTFCGTLYS